VIRAHFGLDRHPFALDSVALLPHQAEILETLRVHCQQGGLCVLVGEPGTGKSVVKQPLVHHDPKRLITPVVNRTLHTYSSVLRILCQAFQIDVEGRDFGRPIASITRARCSPQSSRTRTSSTCAPPPYGAGNRAT